MRRYATIAATLLAAVACDDLNPFGPSGTSETVLAPDSFIGRILDDTPLTASCGQIGVDWFNSTLQFVDASTIRGITDAGGGFDYPSDYWSYERTGPKSGRLFIDWSNPSNDEFLFDFDSETSGAYDRISTSEPGFRRSQRHPCYGQNEIRFTGFFSIRE